MDLLKSVFDFSIFELQQRKRKTSQDREILLGHLLYTLRNLFFAVIYAIECICKWYGKDSI